MPKGKPFIKKCVFKILCHTSLDAIKNLRFSNPYNRDNHQYKCIFIHIPKCAGISIEKAIFKQKVGHNPIWKYKLYDKGKFNKYFKFSFVRNPWDRLVSAYFFLKKGGRNPVDKGWSDKHLKQFEGFNEFVLALNNPNRAKELLSYTHFTPQYKYLIDEDGQLTVDFLGKVEQLSEDFEVVTKRLDLENNLPHLNKSNRDHYKKYYNDKSKNIVANLYQEDIQLFNYKF